MTCLSDNLAASRPSITTQTPAGGVAGRFRLGGDDSHGPGEDASGDHHSPMISQNLEPCESSGQPASARRWQRALGHAKVAYLHARQANVLAACRKSAAVAHSPICCASLARWFRRLTQSSGDVTGMGLALSRSGVSRQSINSTTAVMLARLDGQDNRGQARVIPTNWRTSLARRGHLIANQRERRRRF
jgi:hypothetical protein